MYYSLFVFNFYYKIIGLYFKKFAGLRAVGLPVFGSWVWAGPEPETCLGQRLTVGPGAKF